MRFPFEALAFRSIDARYRSHSLGGTEIEVVDFKRRWPVVMGVNASSDPECRVFLIKTRLETFPDIDFAIGMASNQCESLPSRFDFQHRELFPQVSLQFMQTTLCFEFQAQQLKAGITDRLLECIWIQGLPFGGKKRATTRVDVQIKRTCAKLAHQGPFQGPSSYGSCHAADVHKSQDGLPLDDGRGSLAPIDLGPCAGAEKQAGKQE